VPVDADPFELIDRALAVFSVAGTIGWEGMVRGKPVVCFGPSWYEHYTPGVLRVRTGADLEGIAAFSERYCFDEQALQRYLGTIEQKSLCAYFRRGLKRVMNISEEECVASLRETVAVSLGLTRGL
jgi:hypothetical protein